MQVYKVSRRYCLSIIAVQRRTLCIIEMTIECDRMQSRTIRERKRRETISDDCHTIIARLHVPSLFETFTLYRLIFLLDPINLTLSCANTNAIVETFFTRNSRPVKENRYAIATEYAAIHFVFPRGTWGRKLSWRCLASSGAPV